MARPQKTLRPTHPNAGTAAWYRRKLDAEIKAMHQSLVWWIGAQYRASGLAMDARETDAERLQREMERLRQQWLQHFESLGERLAKMFARKVMGYTDYNAKTAFQALGLTVGMTMTDAMRQAYQGVIGEQVGLIRSIAGQHLDNVQRLVMVSTRIRPKVTGSAYVVEGTAREFQHFSYLKTVAGIILTLHSRSPH